MKQFILVPFPGKRIKKLVESSSKSGKVFFASYQNSILKMRNALPSPRAAITLMGYVAMEMEEKTYSYPISNFNFDSNFNQL